MESINSCLSSSQLEWVNGIYGGKTRLSTVKSTGCNIQIFYLEQMLPKNMFERFQNVYKLQIPTKVNIFSHKVIQ